ncbi:hypothetical protein [Paenarthrobacter sp. NPDC091669]|uniref:hypothetical protein n=1 Tax=Paenarthrobacter sp. NPDC091669 TaxID=3364384 RepID=UPI003808CC3B
MKEIRLLNRRRLTAAAFSAGTVLMLLISGCASAPQDGGNTTPTVSSQATSTNKFPDDGKGATMTPEDASKEFFGLLDEIQALAPNEWVNEDVPAGGYCNFQDTGSGKQFSGGRTTGPLSSAERETLRQKVSAFYELRGYKVQTLDKSTTTNNLLITTAFGPDGLSVALYTGDLGTIIDGSSRCVPDPEVAK